MFFRVKDRLQRTRFNLLCRPIFSTPPLKMRTTNVCLISQVSHRDLVMYLIAIKSFCRFCDVGQIVVLNDGSLTSTDLALISEHLPAIRILGFKDVGPAATPKGGCWERLLLIADFVGDGYVIQIDSDSLTLNEIPEVLNQVAQNCSFTLLGAGSFPGVESMLDACHRAKQNNPRSMEPQAVGERSLDRFPNCSNLKYVRGNAAFAGFARNSFTRSDVEYFSKSMEAICGADKWHEWGSEQVTSNLIIANSTRASVLLHPKYTSYYALAGVDYAQSSFIHFMGTHRFENGCYSTFATRTIRQLMCGTLNRSDFEQDTLMEASANKSPTRQAR